MQVEMIIFRADRLARKFLRKCEDGRARSVETKAECEALLRMIDEWLADYGVCARMLETMEEERRTQDDSGAKANLKGINLAGREGEFYEGLARDEEARDEHKRPYRENLDPQGCGEKASGPKGFGISNPSQRDDS